MVCSAYLTRVVEQASIRPLDPFHSSFVDVMEDLEQMQIQETATS